MIMIGQAVSAPDDPPVWAGLAGPATQGRQGGRDQVLTDSSSGESELNTTFDLI